MSIYLLDANVFIQAKNAHYPFDSFPGFWEWLERGMQQGILRSITGVFDEICDGHDELVEWVMQQPVRECFLSTEDESTQKKLIELASWAQNPSNGFRDTALNEFLSCADCWLVAKALQMDGIIVTHEKYSNGSAHIKIPNVCEAFGVRHINTIDLIRHSGAKFSLVK